MRAGTAVIDRWTLWRPIAAVLAVGDLALLAHARSFLAWLLWTGCFAVNLAIALGIGIGER